MAFRPTQSTSQTVAKSPFFQQRDALVNEIAVVRYLLRVSLQCLPALHDLLFNSLALSLHITPCAFYQIDHILYYTTLCYPILPPPPPPRIDHANNSGNQQELESVLQSINKLNRSLEGVIAVGNEFGNVEALWSQFEGVMAPQEEEEEDRDGDGEGEGEGEAEGGVGAGGDDAVDEEGIEGAEGQ